MKFRIALATCLLTVIGVLPATAVEPPTHLGEGDPLGPRGVHEPALRIMSASPGHYITDVGTPSDDAPLPWDIRTTTDGKVVGNYQRLRDLPDRVPQLVGDYAIETGTDHVIARKIGTTPMVQYDAPAGSQIRGDYPGGMLIVRTADSSFALRNYDGTERPVTGLPADAAVRDRSDSALLLAADSALYVLDLATGTATRTATFTGDLWWAQLTPNRVIWQTGTTDTATNLAWKARTGSGEGTVTVPTRQELLTVGDDVVFRDPATSELTKVDLGSGTATSQFVTNVQDAADLGNGRLLVTAQGSIATVGPDGALDVIDWIPAYAGQSRHVAMAGDRILTDDLPLVDGFASERTAKQVTETRNLGGSWLPLDGVTTTNDLQVAGDSLVTSNPGPSDKWTVRLRTPQDDNIIGNFSRFALGRGGRLAQYQLEQNGPTGIYDTQRRQIVTTLDGPVGIDGDTYWTGSASTLTGRQVGGVTRTIRLGPDCNGLLDLQVAGRWAVLDCIGPDEVVDLNQQIPIRTISLGDGWKIGAGFVVRPITTTADGLAHKQLLVTDLNAATPIQHSYGPVAGRFWRGASYTPDDADTPRIAYIDPDGRPRVITLDWLAAPPTSENDKTPPTLTTATAGPRVSETADLSFSWDYADPSTPENPGSGVSSYDVRYQQRPNASSPYGAWVLPWSWQVLPANVKQVQLPGVARSTDTCFQVRARDSKANLSEWSTSYCSEVDGAAPVHVSSKPGDRVILTSTATYSYSFTDNGAVASYDVAYRTATAGNAFGAWVYPAPWQGITAGSVGWAPVLGSDRCFMVRARDGIGNTSAWSPATCSVTPQDDRALTAAGSVSRTTNTLAFQGTTSTLNASGASLTKSGEAGVRVALVTLNGPGQGSVDVYHAGVKVGRVSLASATWTRKVTYLPVTPYRTGTVQVVSVAAAPAAVDGIALLRS